MGSKGYKGADFERWVCVALSVWWSKGLGAAPPRDDIFWRSSQSGGRATQRHKVGKTTFGSYGDIATLDPIGRPLLELFMIELKRGSSHSSPGDLIDFKAANLSHSWAKCLAQTIKSHKAAGSHAWMMICRRDYRLPIACIDATAFRHFTNRDKFCPRVRFVISLGGEGEEDFVVVPFESFLSIITPSEIIRVLNLLKIKE